jgi:hypothetical protein
MRLIAAVFLLFVALGVAYLSFKYAPPVKLDLRVPPPPSPLLGKGNDLIAA